MICLRLWSLIIYPFSLRAAVMHGYYEAKNPEKSLMWLNDPSFRLQFAIFLKMHRRAGSREIATKAAAYLNKEKLKLREAMMVYNYKGLDDKEMPVRYISGDVEPVLRDLVQKSIEEAYGDPAEMFNLDYGEIHSWVELMRKVCSQLGLNYDAVVADIPENERERFDALVETLKPK
jgi:hypothetical protein